MPEAELSSSKGARGVVPREEDEGWQGAVMELRELTDRVEYVSAGYADQYGVDRTGDWTLLKLTEELGELVQAALTASGRGRDRGGTVGQQREAVADELADVVSMCLVFARQQGIDLEEAITRKWLCYEQVHADRGFTG